MLLTKSPTRAPTSTTAERINALCLPACLPCLHICSIHLQRQTLSFLPNFARPMAISLLTSDPGNEKGPTSENDVPPFGIGS
jgi:hypothetical protein